ncbi:hypothetical protein ACS5PN_24875 [Roseateles sp. NT4]|uniref:hypothetical protein n=1 Tax=Roseateles sp. NT4 TaxID=3453715 RepID=UPI003EEA7BBB
MKHLNHRGSAALLAVTLLLAILLVLSAFGINGDWKAKTTPWRLVNDPFAGWTLLILLSAGLALIRTGKEAVQCFSAVLFAGALFGVGLVSALFWDPWLPNMLLLATLPMLRSAAQTLLAPDPDGKRAPPQHSGS